MYLLDASQSLFGLVRICINNCPDISNISFRNCPVSSINSVHTNIYVTDDVGDREMLLGEFV